ncbi:MAG: hypothetical protein OHK0024_14400 [Thalassobaculales bacterium]
MLTSLTKMFRKDAGEERRQHPRKDVLPGSRVVIDGKAYALHNWSTGGLLFGPCRDVLVARQKFKLSVAVSDGTFDIAFDAEAVVVRLQPDGMVAAQFFYLHPEKRRLIQQYFAHYGLG